MFRSDTRKSRRVEERRQAFLKELWLTAGYQGGPNVVWPDGHKIPLCDWISEQSHPENRPAAVLGYDPTKEEGER